MDNKLLIIDGHSILNRAFYGLPDLTNQAGEHTNAVLGFLNIMLKLIDEEHPSHLIVAFDTSHPTFRHEQFKEYKGTRKPMPEELHEQVPMIKETLQSMNITIIEKPGYEADDIIGTISKETSKAGYKVSIISGDRDLLQLATDNILVRIPKTKMNGTTVEDYYKEDVIARYGVTPTEFIDVKGLMGDPSDNIPGVPGIGEKTATKIIQEYKSIEGALEHIEEIKPKRAKENLAAFKDQSIMSKELATIKLDCDLDYDLKECTLSDLFNENSFLVMKRLEFKNLLKRFEMDIEVPALDFEMTKTSDLGEVDQHFANARKAKTVGISLIVENDILGAALAYDSDQAVYIPIEGMLTKDQLMKQLKQLFESDAQIIGLHLKSIFLYLDIKETTKGIYDAGVAAYLLNPLKDAYEYDDVSRDYLEVMLPSKGELIGKRSYETALEEEYEAALKAICYSAYVPFAAKDKLMELLEKENMLDLYLQIEMPTTYALADMQRRGIRVNREALKEYGDSLIGRIQELEQNIYRQANQEFNINSPKQLGVVLFEDLKIPGGKKNKTGYSTSADVLEKLKRDYPIVNDILEYRGLAKLKSTYADGLLSYINEDERIHGKFHQTITATGRISSTDPNLQNIPVRMPLGRAIRRVFIPEEGYIFVDADYSQIELRILAHLSKDKTLIRAYNEGQDIHAVTASEVFDIPLEEMTPDKRRDAKAVNFGIVYGLSAFGLSEDLGISRKQAADYIDRYFKTYKQVKEFLDHSVEEAKSIGKVRTIFHRIRPIPELTSSNFIQRNFGERVAMNSPVQGSAADIMKIATFRVNMRLKERNMKSRLLLQIHDELLIEASLNEVEEVKKILTEEMMGAADLAVPLEIEINVGNNWFEAK